MKYAVRCTNPKGGGWLDAWALHHVRPMKLYGETVHYTCVPEHMRTAFETLAEADECARQLVLTSKTIKLEASVVEVEA